MTAGYTSRSRGNRSDVSQGSQSLGVQKDGAVAYNLKVLVGQNIRIRLINAY